MNDTHNAPAPAQYAELAIAGDRLRRFVASAEVSLRSALHQLNAIALDDYGQPSGDLDEITYRDGKAEIEQSRRSMRHLTRIVNGYLEDLAHRAGRPAGVRGSGQAGHGLGWRSARFST
ncbi:hypothetical protein ACWDWV_00315 [Streptosporangium sandarakinum]